MKQMITVTVLTRDRKPVEEGTPFNLLSEMGATISSSKTDSAGVVTFDVDAATVGQVAIRLDLESLETVTRDRDMEVENVAIAT